jgi:hypothetical protein
MPQIKIFFRPDFSMFKNTEDVNNGRNACGRGIIVKASFFPRFV